LILAVLPRVDPGAAAARALARLLPASVAMRDSHRWLALLALPVAVGFGAAVDALANRAAGVAALALLAPLAINPGLAWGLAGGLHPVRYPPDWSAARAAVAADPEPGAVLALPWTPLRSYPWAGPLPVWLPAQRLFDRPALWSDTVQVGTVGTGGQAGATGQGGRAGQGGAAGEGGAGRGGGGGGGEPAHGRVGRTAGRHRPAGRAAAGTRRPVRPGGAGAAGGGPGPARGHRGGQRPAPDPLPAVRTGGPAPRRGTRTG